MTDLPRSVAITTNSDERLYRFRAPIVRALVERGVRVYAVAPHGEFASDIEALGAEFVAWRLSRGGVNPFAEAASVASLAGIYRRIRPDVAQHFTIKPNVYGAIAGRLAGVPVVVSGVTGLGYAFAEGGQGRAGLRGLARLLYRLAARLSDGVTFQTAHDAELLMGRLCHHPHPNLPPARGKGLLGRLFRSSGRQNRKALVIPGGSGVDLAVFSQDAVSAESRREMRAALGIPEGAPVVTMASRLLYDKGIVEFVEAARAVRARRQDAVFVLAGEGDPGNRESVTERDLAAWRESGDVVVPGHVEDVPCLLALSSVVALPSYHEGVPRSLIEAAAMGRAIVATDIPGAAAVVEDGVNGTLVPPRDAGALAGAIGALLDDAALRSRYGDAGRRKAEGEFDERVVAARYVVEYARLWGERGAGRR